MRITTEQRRENGHAYFLTQVYMLTPVALIWAWLPKRLYFYLRTRPWISRLIERRFRCTACLDTCVGEFGWTVRRYQFCMGYQFCMTCCPAPEHVRNWLRTHRYYVYYGIARPRDSAS